jgi:hypothetical protein
MPNATGSGHEKDAILDRLAQHANVAQFVSFGPDLTQRHAWVHGCEPNRRFGSLEDAVGALLATSPEASVNVRSFEPHDPKSREFIYGLRATHDVVSNVRRLGSQGLFTIVNETVDVNDGGVSGVAHGNVLEFAPGDTPRAVEKAGTAALPRAHAYRAFETIYGFRPALPDAPDVRVEFSIHPLRRGYRHDHTIVWELEDLAGGPSNAYVSWPNLFSRMLGDKAYGLLVAWLAGLRVPATTVIPRRLAPFSFGDPTGIAEPWLRTAPTEQMPGKFTTTRGWTDPYRLMRSEDPDDKAIASVLSQRGVDARWSGALLSQPDGGVVVEGTAGFGDAFMVGEKLPDALPENIHADVLRVYERASSALGPVRFEWVHDGREVWIVQLHKGASVTQGRVIVPGEAPTWRRFEVTRGIGALRELLATINGEGIVLVGTVGITSHFGDLLRRAKVPSRLEEK